MIPVISGLLISFWFLITVALFFPFHQAKAEAKRLPEYFASLCGGAGTSFIFTWLASRKRANMIMKLTDPLRMLISRLPEQKNITKAMEAARDEVSEPLIRQLFTEYLRDVTIGGSVNEALQNMKGKVKLRKFHIFIDTLIQSHYDGFTAEALNALEKAVEAIEFDLRIIEKVRIKNALKKKNLYSALGVAWLFPLILSMANTGPKNVYLHTLQGKVLLFLYLLGSIYVFVKGEEYLSVRLDEL